MQPLKQMNNVQKAKLLFELLPSEIPAYINYMQAIIAIVERDIDELTAKWNNPIISPLQWLKLARYVQAAIDKYNVRLHQSSRLFTDQLFDGYVALFSIHCLQQYVQHDTLKDPRFKTAVELFF